MEFRRTFQIGCPGTGTRSLAAAVQRMGPELRVVHGVPRKDRTAKISQYVQALLDGSVPQWLYEFDFIGELAAEIWEAIFDHSPDSRFILCERPARSWWESVERRNSRSRVRRIKRRFPHASPYGMARLRLYGSVRPTSYWVDAYLRHNADVKTFFGGADNFLAFNLWKGDGWPELTKFLGLPDPSLPFPRIRTAKG